MIKLVYRMLASNDAEVREAISEWEALLAKRDVTAVSAMERDGWEQVDAVDGAVMLDDGRPVFRVGGAAMAMKVDVFAKHRQDMLDAAKRKGDPDQPKPGESITSVLCPACRGVMAKSLICPNCSKGRSGFKIMCTCTECEHEVYL